MHGGSRSRRGQWQLISRNAPPEPKALPLPAPAPMQASRAGFPPARPQAPRRCLLRNLRAAPCPVVAPGASSSPFTFPRATFAAASPRMSRRMSLPLPPPGELALSDWLDALPVALAVFDGALELVHTNAHYRELTGAVRPPSATGARDAFPVARTDLAPLVAEGRAVGAPRTTRVLADGPDGARAVEVTTVPVAVTGAASGIALLAADVSEREDLRAHLATSVSQLSVIFDLMPESVRVFDRDGRIVRSNALAVRGDGQAAVTTLAQLDALEQPRSMEHSRLTLDQHPAARALRGESVRGEVLLVRSAAGEAAVEVNSNPLRDPAGVVRGAVTVERDITERVRLAQQLEEQVRVGSALYVHVATEAERLEQMVQKRSGELLALQEALARDRRLAAVGQLAAGVMHDVNNALNPIMAAAFLLHRNAADPDLVRDYARRIQKAAETGAATAARVGRFIRQDPISSRPEQHFDLATVAGEAIEIAQAAWADREVGGRIEVVRELAPGVTIEGIAGEVREALLSLLGNAVDAMPAGGRLTVASRRSGDEALLEVRDTGVGMTTEVRERAFEPFFSTKGTRGSGLGLSEVYGIARRHRGRAEITSEPGCGTIVRLRLPVAGTAAPPAAAAPAPSVARRVLLVEDHAEARRLLRELLEGEGHTVVEAGTLAEARASLGAPGGAPPVDVVVSDIFLPDGDGWAFVAELRARFPCLRVGVITGWELAPPPSVAADFTLRKPLAARELLERVAGQAR